MSNQYPQLTPKQEELLRKKISTMDSEGYPIDQDNVEVQQTTNTVASSDVVEVPSQQSQVTTPAYTEETDLKRRIAEIEKELGNLPQSAVTVEDPTYRDSRGNETFYVKNVSGTHIVISDIDNMSMIPVGECRDLLVYTTLDDIKASRDIRRALYDQNPLLIRLTEQQYLEERERQLKLKRKLDIIREQENKKLQQLKVQSMNSPEMNLPHERLLSTIQPTSGKIRSVVEAKLGKLALKNDPDPAKAMTAMQSPEFIQWIYNENLSIEEIEHIMGHSAVINDHNIRAALLEKKAQLV